MNKRDMKRKANEELVDDGKGRMFPRSGPPPPGFGATAGASKDLLQTAQTSTVSESGPNTSTAPPANTTAPAKRKTFKPISRERWSGLNGPGGRLECDSKDINPLQKPPLSIRQAWKARDESNRGRSEWLLAESKGANWCEWCKCKWSRSFSDPFDIKDFVGGSLKLCKNC